MLWWSGADEFQHANPIRPMPEVLQIRLWPGHYDALCAAAAWVVGASGYVRGRRWTGRHREDARALTTCVRGEDGGACPVFHALPGFLAGSPRGFLVVPSASRLVSFLLLAFGFVSSLWVCRGF